MDELILTSIKKLVGLAPEDTSFDPDLLIHINSAVDILRQLGVEADTGFYVDKNTRWDELVEDDTELRLIESYLFMKTRKWFDPPQNGTAMDSLNSSIAELEWRINVAAEAAYGF